MGLMTQSNCKISIYKRSSLMRKYTNGARGWLYIWWRKKPMQWFRSPIIFAIFFIHSNSQIGGVHFNTLTSEEARRLEENQVKIRSLMTISRGQRFSNQNTGEMRAIGSRQPSGGRSGDAYGPYPGITINSLDDIDAIFLYIMVRKN